MKSKKQSIGKFASAYGKFRLFVLEQRYLPRWAVVVIDLSICLLSFILAFLILKDTPIKFYNVLSLTEKALVLVSLHLLCFLLFRTYSGIIRHSTFTDVYRLALATGSVILIAIVGNIIYQIITGDRIFLTTGLLLYAFFSLTLLIAFRITVKEIYRFLRAAASTNFKKRVVILGIDDQTISLTQAMLMDTTSEFRPVAFLSSKEKRKNFKIIDLPVLYSEGPLDNTLQKINAQFEIDGILIVSDLFTVPEKNSIAESCFNLGLDVYNLAMPEQWKKSSDMQIRIAPLQIEDLLERNKIEIDTKLIAEDLYGKTILVTGELEV